MNTLESYISASINKSRTRLGARRAPLGLVLGVSGGEDSMVLLYGLLALERELNVRLTVAHFDHRLRQSSSDDAEFVRTICEEFGVSFRLGVAGPRSSQLNIEAWARSERYRFLERIRHQTRSHLVLTAHHQRDQVETLLMRMSSGRLLTSSYSIAEFDWRRKLLRPLLRVSKEEIREYRLLKEIPHCEDETNEDLSRTRNALRSQVLPLLGQITSGSIRAIGRFAEKLGSDERYLWSVAREKVREGLSVGENRLQVERVLCEPPPIGVRMLLVAAEDELGALARRVSWLAAEEFYHRLSSLMASASGASGAIYLLPSFAPSEFDLRCGVRARVEKGGDLFFYLCPSARERCKD